MCRRIVLAPVFISVLLALFAAGLARADYPIVSHRYAADPAGVEFNGRIYLYSSNDDDNGTNGYDMHSITCFSSDDLKNWTDHGVVLDVPAGASWAGLSWAPSAISNSSRIYLYFANGAGSIGVTTNTVPTGPFKDARGSSLVNSSTPGASTPTQWLFDPCALVDDDGTPYLYFGGQYPTNARVIRLGANLTSVVGSARLMFATNFFEASYMHKRGGIYYYTYCNRFEFGAAIYCETNSNPTNGFVPQGTVLANPPQNVNNNNHHSIFQYGTNWYIAYHNRAAALQNGLASSAAVYKRSLCLDRVNYNANGAIQQVTATTDGLVQLKNLDPYVRVEGETIAKQSGIKTELCSEGGLNVTSITNGSWIRVRGVDFGTGPSNFVARVASGGSGGNIELHIDSLAGTIIGTCPIPPTGGWQSWTSVSTNVGGVFGVHDLYLKFTGATSNLFNVNWWQFNGSTNSVAVPSLKVEAESGTSGSHWALSNSASPIFITITSNATNSHPVSSHRVATYSLMFPAAGSYQLYARVRVGPLTFNDDSMFYANDFGLKSPTTDSDWVLVNGLGSAGFSNSTDVVTGGGSLGGGMWKWINLSQFTSRPGFTVSEGNLAQLFQIGAREDGLGIDKFVFGTAGYTYTVSDLDNAIAPAPALRIAPSTSGQFQIAWPGAAGYVLEQTTNLVPPVNWSQMPGPVNSSNGQNFVIVTNNGPVTFYRLRQ